MFMSVVLLLRTQRKAATSAMLQLPVPTYPCVHAQVFLRIPSMSVSSLMSETVLAPLIVLRWCSEPESVKGTALGCQRTFATSCEL